MKDLSGKGEQMDNGEKNYRRFLDGDSDALAELIKEYKDGLTFYLAGFVKNLETAEELTQDTFVKLYVKKPKFSGRSGFKTFLYSIGRHTALDYIRKHKKDTLDCDFDENSGEYISAENGYFKTERNIDLFNAMKSLKSDHYRVLWLTYFENLSNKETAALMKKSLGSTQVLLTRARAALKAELEKEGITDENL